MKYSEWLVGIPTEISDDPIWRLEVYRLALFADDVGWSDVLVLAKHRLRWGVADQLHRSLGSISANLTEGYSRSRSLDRARFFEFSLGSARESRDWYYKSRQVLPVHVIEHRLGLTTQIIGMLAAMIPHQRKNAIRETEAEYAVLPQPSGFSIDSPIPMP